jgi:hypothetical protein
MRDSDVVRHLAGMQNRMDDLLTRILNELIAMRREFEERELDHQRGPVGDLGDQTTQPWDDYDASLDDVDLDDEPQWGG